MTEEGALTMDRIAITIERTLIQPCRAMSGGCNRWWSYQCFGPDGRRFDNTSIVELRRVLKRRYGRAVQTVEPWKAQAMAKTYTLELTRPQLEAVVTALDATARAGDEQDALSYYSNPPKVAAAERALDKASALLNG